MTSKYSHIIVFCVKVIQPVLMLFFSGSGKALDLTVSLHNDHMVRSALFTVVEGSYQLSQGSETRIYYPGDAWYFLIREDTLFTRGPNGVWSAVEEVSFQTGEEGAVFSLKPVDPVLPSQEYNGALRVGAYLGSLHFLNTIELERYIMGVAETEAGPACPLEYYKVQAILCRTFALKNFYRHIEEGFNLCDGIHCQSYKGRNIWNEDVEIGTEVTSSLVICDRDTNLINPVYHSNSGGETQGAEKVWLKGEPYLKPVLDPFSVGQRNASWERKMALRDWLNYLLSYNIRFPADADTADLEMHLRHRTGYYRVFDDSLAVSSIREDFNFRSDYFDVLVDRDTVRIAGRGYGHGVGLSQEGAIEMARRRYHYTAILNYYYDEIMILPYFDLKDLFSQ
jgi:stage II sporulation protein D